MTKKRTWTNDQLEKAILNSTSIRSALQLLNLRPTGGNYAQFRKYANELKFDISHFRGQGWNTGLKFHPNPARPLTEILVEHSTFSSHHLRKRLLKERVFDHQCANCKNTTWMNQPIPLELEHKNGNRTDNRIENIELLCPNCHALTSTYRGKNWGAYS